MASSIIDVAKRCGYSKATVSRAFASPEKVKPKTRDAIYAAAQALNYTPNAIAQAMVRQKTFNIAFILYEQQYPLMLNPFYSEIFQGILEESAKQGYSVFVSSDRDLRLPTGEIYLKKQMDGIIIAGRTDKETVQTLQRQNIPVILLNNYLDLENVSCVVSDDLSGAKSAMEHLVSKGHKKIALIAGDFSPHIYQSRYEAYVSTLAKYSIPLQERYIANIEPSKEQAYGVVKAMLQEPNPPSALFCTNDTIAVGALKAALHCGLRVPQDVAILGYDDSDFCTMTEPELSSVAVAKSEMGCLTASTLIAQMENTLCGKRMITTQATLIERGST